MLFLCVHSNRPLLIWKTDHCGESTRTDKVKRSSTVPIKKTEAGNPCTHCMFPFGIIFQGRWRHCFLMRFLIIYPESIGHLNDFGVNKNRRICRSSNVGYVYPACHFWQRDIQVEFCHLATLQHCLYVALFKTAPCLFGCCLIADGENKFNHAKSSSLSEQHGACSVLNAISFLSGEAHTHTHRMACAWDYSPVKTKQ